VLGNGGIIGRGKVEVNLTEVAGIPISLDGIGSGLNHNMLRPALWPSTPALQDCGLVVLSCVSTPQAPEARP